MFVIRLDTIQPLNDIPMLLLPFTEWSYNDSGNKSLLDILAYACRALAETEKCSFVVSGFGQLRWPVDVRTDLLVFLEQLLDFSEWLNSSALQANEFEVDFFEQGVERLLTFRKTGLTVEVVCISYTTWQPLPKSEIINQVDLSDALLALVQNFRFAVKQVCPNLYHEELLSQWFDDVIKNDQHN